MVMVNSGQIVTRIVNDSFYNVNSWILNVHLQSSVVIPVIFIVVYLSISHDMVKLRLSQMFLEMPLQDQNFPLIS